MEQKYPYQKMLEDFNRIGRGLEKLPLSEDKILNIIRAIVYDSKKEKEQFKQNKNYEKIMGAINEYGAFEKKGDNITKVDGIEANTECVIPVEPGKEFTVIQQINKYFKDRSIDVRDFKKPEIVNGRIKIKTTSEYAKGISDYVQSDELLGQKSSVIEEENQWIINVSNIKGASKIGINPPGLHSEDIAEQSAVLIKEYINDMTKKRSQDRDAAAGFNLEGFEKYVESKNKDTGNNEKTKANEIKNDKPKEALNKAVLENLKTKKDEYQRTAFEQYKKHITDIIQNGQNVTPADYSWALEQFKNSKYSFSEMNKEGTPTNFSVKGELLVGGGEFQIATYDFKKPETKDVRHDDMKQVVSEHAAEKGRTLKEDAPAPIMMHKLNQDPTRLCNKIRNTLGFDDNHPIKIGGEYNFDGKDNGTQMFRKILYMLRESNQTKTEEQIRQQSEQQQKGQGKGQQK